jgi:hypothetical protein
MNKSFRTSLLAPIFAVSVGAVITLAGCSEASHEAAGTGSPAATSPSSPTPSKTQAAAGTVANPLPQGTAGVTDHGSQWDVTLTELNTDGTAAVLAQNQFNTIAAGSQYVTGKITATINKNLTAANTGQQVSASGSVEPVYVGNDGKIYQSFSDSNSLAAVDGDWNQVPQVVANVGVSSTGSFAIPVPSSAVAGGHFGISNIISSAIVYFQ